MEESVSHSEPIADRQGTFTLEKAAPILCRQCKQPTVTETLWESNCGGYEDYKYECKCGYFWWVDGLDA